MNKIDKECIERYDDFFKRNIEKTKDSKIRPLIKHVNDNYEGLVHRAAKLIIELAGDKQHNAVYFGLFVYLYRNGYFSKDNQFQFDKSENELDFLLGASVVQGKGVCRHIATLQKDIMNEISSINGNKSRACCLGVNSEHHKPSIMHKDVPQNFQLKYNQKMVETDNFELPGSAFKQDHVDVMIISKKNGKETYTIFDPTNFVIEELDIKDIDYEREGTAMDLRWNLMDYNYFSHKSEDEILQYLNSATKAQHSLAYAKRITLDKETMELIVKYSIYQCEKEKDKISNFYNSTKQCRKLIDKGIIDCTKVIERNAEER